MMILFCIDLPVGALDDLDTCASVCLAETDCRYFDATTVSDKIPNVLCGSFGSCYQQQPLRTTKSQHFWWFVVGLRGRLIVCLTHIPHKIIHFFLPYINTR